MPTTKRITQESFEAFLKCARKSHLVSEGAIGAQGEFQGWPHRLEEKYKEAASARLRSSIPSNEWYVGTPPAEWLREGRYRLVFDYTIAELDVHARLQALEVDCSRACGRHCSYTPIRFVSKEKLATRRRQRQQKPCQPFSSGARTKSGASRRASSIVLDHPYLTRSPIARRQFR